MSTTNDILRLLPIISLQLNRIAPLCQLLLGTVGNLMNILVFTRPSLRANPCAFYFLSLSINNLFVLYVALLTRYLSSGWHLDPSNHNTVLCKLRILFVYSSLCLIQWFVVLASIDRFFSSCHQARFRQWSNLRLARKLVALTVCLAFTAHFHTLIWWTVDYIGADLYCNIFLDEYEIAFQVFFLIFSCLLPPALMTIFGILTIVNVRRIHRHVQPENQPARFERLRAKDRQLITMLLIQVLVTVLCTAPFAIVNIYDMSVKNIDLPRQSLVIQTFFDNVGRVILYFNPIIAFFVYTLSGQTFRKEMRCLVIEIVDWLCRRLHIEPCFRQNRADNSTQ